MPKKVIRNIEVGYYPLFSTTSTKNLLRFKMTGVPVFYKICVLCFAFYVEISPAFSFFPGDILIDKTPHVYYCAF